MPDLSQTLKASAKRNREDIDSQDAVATTQRLIPDGGAEDMSILREMGMHASVMQAVEIRGAKMELEALEKKYGQIFTKDEIKSVAKIYALKFRRSSEYKGPVDPVMLQKIKAFFKDSGIEMNDAKLGYNMYVLAPSKTFSLPPRPNPKPPDPVLFYKLDETHFRMIHKWGSDLNPWRRMMGFKYMNIWTYMIYWVTVLAVTGALPLAVLYNYWMYKGGQGWMAIPIIAAGVAITIAIWRAADDDIGGDWKNWDELWDDGFKPKI